MMKLYAVAVVAQKGGEVTCFAGAVVRDSEDAARGAGLKMAYQAFPMSVGYSSHGCSIAEIPAETLALVAL